MQNHHLMQKVDEDGEPIGDIIKVELNEWQNYRATGHVFVSQEKDDAPVEAEEPVNDEDDKPPTMENTKDEILAWAEDNNIEVNASDTKSEILWGIAQVLEIDPVELGVDEE